MHKPIVWMTRLVVAASLTVSSLVLAPPASYALSPGLSFGAANAPTWQTNDVVYGLAAARGLVFAGGSFTKVRPPAGVAGTEQARAGLVVLDAGTGAPASCQFNLGGTARVRAVTASADGATVYIGGEFSSVNGLGRARVAALDVANCSVRSGFNAGALSAEVFGLAAHGDTLYLAGGFLTVRAQTRNYFAAVNATTGALLPWVANGQSYPGAPPARRGRAVAVSPDGLKVALGGYFFYLNGTYSHSIAMVSAAAPGTGAGGNVLRSYPPGFIPGDPTKTSTTQEAPQGNSATHTIYSSSDGRFYIGNEGTGHRIFDGRAAFSWASGDQLWRDTCYGATQAVLEHRGTLYSASHAHNCDETDGFQDGRRVYFQAEDAATGQLIGWEPKANNGTGEGLGPRALAVATASSGKPYLWAGGEFTTINGTAQQGLTRFSDASLPPSTPVIAGQGTSDGKIQIRLRTAVDPDDSELTYRLLRSGTSTPIAITSGSSVWWRRPQVTLVDPSPVTGQLNSYRVQVSDGVNTVTSGTVSVSGIAVRNDYAATVRADHPTLLWSGPRSGSFLFDTGAGASAGDRLGGRMEKGAAVVADTPVAGGGGALSLDGVDDYVWNDAWRYGPTTYSIEAWVRTTTKKGGKIVGYGNGRPNTTTGATVLSATTDRNVYLTPSGRAAFGAGSTTVSSSKTYNDGKWHHLVATQGSAGMALYVDGQRVATSTNTRTRNYRGVWHVGGDSLSGWSSASNFFAGLIAETAIYDTVLSQTAVTRHYEARTAAAADVTPPSPPSGLAAQVNDTSVNLSWTAATDDVGVAGYRIHRGTSATFAVDTANRIGNTPTTSFVAAGQPAGTNYYKVVAVDASGNVSAASSAAAATVSAPAPEPVAVKVVASADAGVSQALPTTNYGSLNQLFARGTPAQQAFLRFEVPAAPSGMVLTKAVLSVRTSGDTTAGSADTFDLQLVSGAWSESTLVWNNRPTTMVGDLGNLTGATQTRTAYQANLAVGVLDAQLGRPVTVRISGIGGDNVRVGSREETASYQPSITFTFEAS